MTAGNSRDAALREVVSKRLDRFFADLTAQLAAGSMEICSGIAHRLTREPLEKASDADVPHPSALPQAATRQQPVQQQQSRVKSRAKKITRSSRGHPGLPKT